MSYASTVTKAHVRLALHGKPGLGSFLLCPKAQAKYNRSSLAQLQRVVQPLSLWRGQRMQGNGSESQSLWALPSTFYQQKGVSFDMLWGLLNDPLICSLHLCFYMVYLTNLKYILCLCLFTVCAGSFSTWELKGNADAVCWNRQIMEKG